MPREFDGPWKETLDLFFEFFVAFFFPKLHAQIDWREAPISLDAELQKILREGEIGPGRVDKLFRVKWKDGKHRWLYIHVEVQSQYDSELARRIFVYHTRIFNLYNEHPVNLVILGDQSPTWRPFGYNCPHLDSEIRLPFWSAKLLDFENRWDELESHDNPLGLIVSAHLRSLQTVKEPKQRLDGKTHLIRRLLTRGFEPLRIRELYKVIDWLLELPDEENSFFLADLLAMEQEFKMEYVTTLERSGIQKGLLLGRKRELSLALTIKFSDAGKRFAEEHLDKADAGILDRIHDSLLNVATLDELKRILEIAK